MKEDPRQRPLLLLDLGNVLLHYRPERFIMRVAAQSQRSEEDIRARYIRGKAKRDFERGILAENSFFKEMSLWLGWPQSAETRLKEIWSDVFDPVDGAEEAVSCLRSVYRLWIASDTNPTHLRYVMHKFPFLSVVERYFVSFESGYLKTNQRAFTPILKAANCGPEHIHFLDDIPRNVVCASCLGLSAHLFRSWEASLSDFL